MSSRLHLPGVGKGRSGPLLHAARTMLSGLVVGAMLTGGVHAQQATRTQPVEGMRDNGTGYHALTGARVVTAPGQVLDNATIVIRDGLIQEVSRGERPPAGARVWGHQQRNLQKTLR